MAAAACYWREKSETRRMSLHAPPRAERVRRHDDDGASDPPFAVRSVV